MKAKIVLSFILAACIISPQLASAADAEKPAPAPSERSKMLIGAPVNVNLQGSATLPKGVLLTVLNATFSDKSSYHGGAHLDPTGPTPANQYNGPDVFSQVWLLKLRYGVTDAFEIWSTTPYLNNHRDWPAGTTLPAQVGSERIHGLMDLFAGIAYTWMNERWGDSFSFSSSAAIMLPTASSKTYSPPGAGTSGLRLQTGIGKWLTKDLKAETEMVWVTRFNQSGNRAPGAPSTAPSIRLGDQFQWNGQVRYFFNNFDVAVETTFVQDMAAELTTGRSMANKSKVWVIGPSFNVPIDPLRAWFGLGIFFPIMRDYQSPTKVEDYRLELKFGKLW